MLYVVPLDGSQLAEQSLPLAKSRVQQFGGALALVRVVNTSRPMMAAAAAGSTAMGPSPAAIEGAEAQIQMETEDATRYLEALAGSLRNEGFNASWEVRKGIAATEIIAFAKEKQADVIAISTHGRTGLGRAVLGSVADEVIRTGGIPVLVTNSR